jgi:rRNA maturation protein Nop10
MEALHSLTLLNNELKKCPFCGSNELKKCPFCGSNELKKCPFCGSGAKLKQTRDSAGWWYAECESFCTRQYATETMDDAVDNWNARDTA